MFATSTLSIRRPAKARGDEIRPWRYVVAVTVRLFILAAVMTALCGLVTFFLTAKIARAAIAGWVVSR